MPREQGRLFDASERYFDPVKNASKATARNMAILIPVEKGDNVLSHLEIFQREHQNSGKYMNVTHCLTSLGFLVLIH